MANYPESNLTYDLIGCGYDVFNQLKFGYQEKYYQRAYAIELENKNLKFSQEHKIIIEYQGQKIGRYFIDFLVENKIVVELKVASDFHQKHISQILAYMRTKKITIGLILLFTKSGLQVKRLII